jgi:single-stranded DNA-binding protein
MLNPNNTIHLYGRLTADAEKVMDGKMLRFSVAVDNAGYDPSNPDNKSGFFNCKIWLTDSPWSAPGYIKSVEQLFDAGRLVKGASVRLIGQLNHDRWTDKNDNKRSDVSVVVESIESYAKSTGTAGVTDTTSSDSAQVSGSTASYSSAEPF